MANHTQILKPEIIKAALGRTLDVLLPPRCVGCSTRLLAHGMLCPKCWGTLKPIVAPCCASCGLPFEFSVGEDAECAQCLKETPAFDWARSAVQYDDFGRSLVLKLKHGKVNAVVPVMAHLMAATVQNRNATLVVPVPLHRTRLFSRRFNQSQLIGTALAKKLNLPLDPFSLVKHRRTPSQAGLKRKGRMRNVKGVFSVPKQRAEYIKAQQVLLVDDVLTTGATADACAKALKRAGAASVGVVTFARVGEPARP